MPIARDYEIMSKASNRNKPKNVRFLQTIVQLGKPKEFRIPPLEQLPDQGSLNTICQLLESISKLDAQEQTTNFDSSEQLGESLHLLAEMATGLWRVRQKMLISGTDQPKEEMYRAFRPLEATYQLLYQSGMEIIDRIQQPYVTGMAEKVIAFEPAPGISREMVIETVKPTVYYRGQLLLLGEIIVGIPTQDDHA